MVRLCIGVLTHCDSKKMPLRFEIVKKALMSLEKIARPDVHIHVWDNNSSDEFREFLSSCSFFDKIYFSDENFFDIVAVNCLLSLANKLDAEFVCHLEDDFLFYDSNFLDSCFEFLENNEDCGYLRILKYDVNNKDIYDKFKNHPNKDVANCQRHFNNISKEPLSWINAGFYQGRSFYKNNWHWYNYANICRREVFAKIVPKEDCDPLHGLEGIMMKNYHDLGLQVGVLDQGVVTHLDGAINKDTSIRISLGADQRKLEKISLEKVLREIDKRTKE